MGNVPTRFASILLSCYDFCLSDNADERKSLLHTEEDSVSLSSVESEDIPLKLYLRSYKNNICRDFNEPFACQNHDNDTWGDHLVFQSAKTQALQTH